MTTFDRGLYWHDYVDPDEEKLDLEIQVLKPLEKNEIYFLKPIECREFPQCLEEKFDVLFFDWGGMSLGNSLINNFCSYIYKHAENNPNRFYIMVSSFTKAAMEDAIIEFGDKKPFNLFLSVDDFGEWLKEFEAETHHKNWNLKKKK